MDDPNRVNENERKKRVGMALIISLMGLAMILLQTDTFSNTGIGEELFKDLCDSFFTVGILYILFGILTLSAKNGTFNFFSYNGRELLMFILPAGREDKKHMPYHEYVLDKEEKRKKWNVGHILIIGGIYCAIGVVFLALYSYYPY